MFGRFFLSPFQGLLFFWGGWIFDSFKTQGLRPGLLTFIPSGLFRTYRRAKLPEGADQKTMLPQKTPVKLNRSTVPLALPVCLSDWLGGYSID